MRGTGERGLAAAVLLLAACGDSSHERETGAPSAVALPDCYDAATTTGQDVATHACSWVHGALALQRGLEADTPFGDVAFSSTHNSFNSRVYPGPSSRLDPNQFLSLSEQLALDIDSIELDVHWVYHAAAGGKAPVVCHGLGAEAHHLGCTALDNSLSDTLEELAAWLATPAAEGRVIWIDIENVLADPASGGGSTPSEAGHVQAVAELEAALGPYLYRPPTDGACHALPLVLTRAQVLAAGKRVVLTSDCGLGTAWPAAIFDIRSVRTQKANDGFAPAPDCGAPSFGAEDYATRHTRIWEDDTKLSALTDPALQPISADDLREMLGCGINTVSLDQWTADDARYPALVWSWAEHQPAGAGCALLDAGGHFTVADCSASHRHACHDGAGWRLGAAAGAWDEGARCDGAFAVPASAAAQGALTQLADGEPVWVDYRSDADGRTWTAEQARY